MRTNEFLFDFPPELIAQEPITPRDASRMLVLNRQQQTLLDSTFSQFPTFFKAGDVLILNNTKVLPARLVGKKVSGGKVEVLLVRRILDGEGGCQTVGAAHRLSAGSLEDGHPQLEGRQVRRRRMPLQPPTQNIWECLIRSMKGLHEGSEIIFESEGRTISAFLKVEDDKNKTLVFPPDVSVPQLMNQIGVAPLPPYIKRPEPKLEDLGRYQTVFAEKEGAIAAPTASLHFTPAILNQLKNIGVEIGYITLHVGLGTFQSVEAEHVEDHPMQEEFYEIPPSTLEAIERAKKEGRPVSAVGTTTVRAVESYFVSEDQKIGDDRTSQMHSTSLFIHPGYKFKIIDRLLTNFHQPKSTPLFLTSAFAGKDFVFRAYRHAIEQRYRLFSYGDCMWVM